MPLKDFECASGHVHEEIVNVHTMDHDCPECGQTAHMVFLKPSKLDWGRMAQGTSAGPEFIDRFDKIRRKQKDKEIRAWNTHGDYGPGVDTVLPRQPGEDKITS